METQNSNEPKKINFQVLNLNEGDLQDFEINGQPQKVLDLNTIKQKGADFVSIHNEKEGIQIQVQSHKEDLFTISDVALQLLDKSKQNKNLSRSYT